MVVASSKYGKGLYFGEHPRAFERVEGEDKKNGECMQVERIEAEGFNISERKLRIVVYGGEGMRRL